MHPDRGETLILCGVLFSHQLLLNSKAVHSNNRCKQSCFMHKMFQNYESLVLDLHDWGRECCWHWALYINDHLKKKKTPTKQKTLMSRSLPMQKLDLLTGGKNYNSNKVKRKVVFNYRKLIGYWGGKVACKWILIVLDVWLRSLLFCDWNIFDKRFDHLNLFIGLFWLL